MIKSIVALTSISLLLTACQLGESKPNAHQPPIKSQDSKLIAKAEALCDRLSEIKRMPFHNEKVDDEVYNGLIELKEAAIPCLIDKLTDTTRMTDPRQAPSVSDFRVGDVAFFVLLDIVNVPFDVPFERILPQEVMSKWEDEGVYAYFKYTETPENRKLLQERWRTWFQQKH